MIAVLVLAAVVGGALMAAQGPIYTRIAGLLGGPLQAAMLAFALGAAALLMLLFAMGAPFPRRENMAEVPVWLWGGGLFGVYAVLTSIWAVPRLGVASYMVCVIVGQLAASYAYDRFGAFGLVPRAFSTANLIGLGMVATGAALAVWR